MQSTNLKANHWWFGSHSPGLKDRKPTDVCKVCFFLASDSQVSCLYPVGLCLWNFIISFCLWLMIGKLLQQTNDENQYSASWLVTNQTSVRLHCCLQQILVHCTLSTVLVAKRWLLRELAVRRFLHVCWGWKCCCRMLLSEAPTEEKPYKKEKNGQYSR